MQFQSYTMAESWKCDICRQNSDDPVEYGEIYRKSMIKVHYYCLLTATHLPQMGGTNSGILGFLIRDIKKEMKAACQRYCFYCSKANASIKCANCNIYFHLKCGLEKDCLMQYVDEFKSYCHDHHNIKHKNPHEPNEGCFICRKKMGIYNSLTSITSECCSTNGWVHRRCLKEYALSAGYYLKCLWCTNTNFRNYVRLHGIFVPDRDASWEKIKGAYSELYDKVGKECQARPCKCPNGSRFKDKKWKIQLCVTCGSSAIHNLCHKEDKTTLSEFICQICKNTFSSEKKTPMLMKKNNDNDDEFFDNSFFIIKSQETFSYPTGSLSEMLPPSQEIFCTISSDDSDNDSDDNNNCKNENFRNNDQQTAQLANIQKTSCTGFSVPEAVSDNDDHYDVYMAYNSETGEIVGLVECFEAEDENDVEKLNKAKLIPKPKDDQELKDFLLKLIDEYISEKNKNKSETTET